MSDFIGCSQSLIFYKTLFGKNITFKTKSSCSWPSATLTVWILYCLELTIGKSSIIISGRSKAWAFGSLSFITVPNRLCSTASIVKRMNLSKPDKLGSFCLHSFRRYIRNRICTMKLIKKSLILLHLQSSNIIKLTTISSTKQLICNFASKSIISFLVEHSAIITQSIVHRSKIPNIVAAHFILVHFYNHQADTHIQRLRFPSHNTVYSK